MFHFAFVNNSHCLESTMRMLADAAALVRRRELHGAGVIKQQERAEDRPQVGVGKERPHGEPVADPMLVHTALDAAQLLDGLYFIRCLH
jgi:hypothetical protein